MCRCGSRSQARVFALSRPSKTRKVVQKTHRLWFKRVHEVVSGALGEESFCSPVPSGLTTISALSFVADERRNANRFPSGENVTALSAPERMPSLYNPRATAADRPSLEIGRAHV